MLVRRISEEMQKDEVADGRAAPRRRAPGQDGHRGQPPARACWSAPVARPPRSSSRRPSTSSSAGSEPARLIGIIRPTRRSRCLRPVQRRTSRRYRRTASRQATPPGRRTTHASYSRACRRPRAAGGRRHARRRISATRSPGRCGLSVAPLLAGRASVGRRLARRAAAVAVLDQCRRSSRITRRSGCAESTRPSNVPSSSNTSSWGSGAGRPCQPSHVEGALSLQPTRSWRRASAQHEVRPRVFGQRSVGS